VVERSTADASYLEFDLFADHPDVTHAIFTRRKGHSKPPFAGLNASFVTGDDASVVARNKDAVISALGLPLVGARPVHGSDVLCVDDYIPPDPLDAAMLQQRIRPIAADAMITAMPGFALCWAFGDCAALLFYDPRQRVVGLAHAGWRGTAQAVALRTLEALEQRYGSRRADVLVGIGPAIGSCCYAVGEEVRRAFASDPLVMETAYFEERTEAGKTGVSLFLDVGRSNYAQLLAAGIPAGHIERADYCTGCRTDLFYSHRKEPSPTGRFAVAIGLKQTPDTDPALGDVIRYGIPGRESTIRAT